MEGLNQKVNLFGRYYQRKQFAYSGFLSREVVSSSHRSGFVYNLCAHFVDEETEDN